MTRTTAATLLAFAALNPGPAAAQSKWTIPDNMKLYGDVKVPIFPEMKEDPVLPRVLLVGDSISMYYTPEVRFQLRGKANVYRIPDNGTSTLYALQTLDNCFGD